MKFAKIVFCVAAVWGFLILAPLLFMFNVISQKDPPPITHPAFYYGFAVIALAWQIAFVVIARDPVRFRLMMIPSVLEKFGYGVSLTVLYLQQRLHASDLVFGGVDLLFGMLFAIAFVMTSAEKMGTQPS